MMRWRTTARVVHAHRRAMTLMELLVTIAINAIAMLMIIGIIQFVSSESASIADGSNSAHGIEILETYAASSFPLATVVTIAPGSVDFTIPESATQQRYLRVSCTGGVTSVASTRATSAPSPWPAGTTVGTATSCPAALATKTSGVLTLNLASGTTTTQVAAAVPLAG